MPSTFLIAGADVAETPPKVVRRLWIKRRASISSAAVDLLLERALGDLPADTISWPIPAWAGTSQAQP